MIWGTARLIALASLCVLADRRDRADACSAAFEAQAWDAAVTACDARIASGAGDDDDRLRRLWALTYQNTPAAQHQIVALAPPLYDTRVGTDAMYLCGRVLARIGAGDDGRRLLWRSLARYAIAGRPGGVQRASSDLARAASAIDRYQTALALARLGVRSSTGAEEQRNALLALADAYDLAGQNDPAVQALFDAEDLAAPSPSARGWTYLKHGEVLLDRHTDGDTAAALAYLDQARADARLAAPDADLAIGIELNRAVALAHLARDDEAAAALAGAMQLDPEIRADPIYDYVDGLLAAHRGDAAAGEQALARAVDAGLPPDYVVAADLALAALHRRAHRDADAERVLRAAIALVEGQRVGGDVELRPWILAHRAAPYRDLVALLDDAGRDADALAVLEAGHSRAWLERRGGEPRSAPSAAELLAAAGDREVLVLVELGPTLWRAHLLGGAVTVDAIDGGAAVLAALAAAPDDVEVAARAGRALIPDGVVASDRPLYVVASGRLAAVPFAALRRGGRTLVDDRPIARLPGLVVLACRAPRAAGGDVVVIGDSRGDLSGAAGEATAVAARFHVTAALGPAATTAAVIAARHAPLLHVAVHGAMTDAGGGLAMADGVIDGAAIRAHELAPTVVVLAGCQTGTSRDPEAWGALPSAFLGAGSEFVVATTRSVDDRAAAAVVHAFYAQPVGDPIHRLASTQRALASVLPASAWASFAAWGVLGCE